jgi:hypothetical protein
MKKEYFIMFSKTLSLLGNLMAWLNFVVAFFFLDFLPNSVFLSITLIVERPLLMTVSLNN